jgi:hypothetical protein
VGEERERERESDREKETSWEQCEGEEADDKKMRRTRRY